MSVPVQTIAIDRLTPGRQGVRLKTIALPAEHGGWGLLLEPALLGLLLAPSVAGFCLTISALAFFLARQPLTLLLLNLKRESPRTIFAKRFAAFYLAMGAASLLAAFIFSNHSFAAALLPAVPLAIIQLRHDWTGRRRVLRSEIAGAAAIAFLAPAIVLCGGWSRPAAFALWAIVIARVVPAILYVRAYLARSHGRSASVLSVGLAHIGGVVVVSLLAESGLAPKLAVFALLVLLARAMITLSAVKATAKQLGFSEIAFGVFTAVIVVLGQALRF